MSNQDNGNDKSRKPDFYLQLAQEGRHGKERITDVGVLWQGKNGYLTGDTIAGRIIAQPRDAREELQRMRKEESESPETAHGEDMKP